MIWPKILLCDNKYKTLCLSCFISFYPTVTLFSINQFIPKEMDWCLFWDLSQTLMLLLLNTKLKTGKSWIRYCFLYSININIVMHKYLCLLCNFSSHTKSNVMRDCVCLSQIMCKELILSFPITYLSLRNQFKLHGCQAWRAVVQLSAQGSSCVWIRSHSLCIHYHCSLWNRRKWNRSTFRCISLYLLITYSAS